MTRFRAFAASLLACAVLPPSTARADYVFTSISVPGDSDEQVFGINDFGELALSGSTGSYLYTKGVYLKIPVALGYDNTSASSINNAGVIVGTVSSYDYAANVFTVEKGFILDGGAFSYVSRPGALTTSFRNIGNGGLITGDSTYANGSDVGFIYDPRTKSYTDLFPGSALTIIGGTNTAGQAVGTTYPLDSAAYSFLRQPDGTIVDVGESTFRARGINDQGLIAGFVNAGSAYHAFVGNSSGYQTFDVPTSITHQGSPVDTIIESINNAGQVAGFWYDRSDLSATHAFIASPASLPVGTTANGSFVFNASVIPDVPIFIDPAVATGYDYAIGSGDPLFASVTLPIGIGDSLYTIVVDGQTFTIAGGTEFDFEDHGFADGVAAFRVLGIEIDAALDPLNPAAFVTELTFEGAGRFTGTQTPLVTIVNAVPEPDEWALLGLVAIAFVLFSRVRPPGRSGSVGAG